MYYVNISQRYELILTKIHWQLENYVCLCLIFTYANIVHTVKMCYKIKIDSGDFGCCFYGVLLRYLQLLFAIKPLLHADSSAFRGKARLCCFATVAVWEC